MCETGGECFRSISESCNEPETIVLGGGVVADGYIHAKIMELLNPTTMRFVSNGVVITKLNPEFIGLLGAGAVAMNM